MSNDTELIKTKVDVVDLIRDYVQLKQSGSNWKGVCPFHSEKTPSFMVSQEKRMWHCFGCSEGGDIFTFLMKMEGVDFPEALNILAERAGVKLQKFDPKASNQKTQLLDAMEEAASFFHKALLENKEAESVREYLKKRGVKPESIEQFKIGYAPDGWDNLLNHLLKKNFKHQDLITAGLINKKAATKHSGGNAVRYYDRFRGRLIFPIQDVHGRVVGFGARALKEDDVPKYLNSPDTPLYDKSKILYGLNHAKKDVKKLNFTILVEGYMDVIASHQVGIRNVVSVSGTAMTKDQAQLLKRYSPNMAIAFDADVAGAGASDKGIAIAMAEEMNVRVITMAKGKDPDECIKADPQAWKQSIESAKSIMDYTFAKATDDVDFTKVENKKRVAKTLLTAISKLPDPVERTHYLQKLSSIINVSEDVLRDALPQSQNTPAKTQARKQVKVVQPLIEERLLALVLRHPDKSSIVFEKLGDDNIADEDRKMLYKELLSLYNSARDKALDFSKQIADISPLFADLPQIKTEADRLGLLADKEYANIPDAAILEEITRLTNRLNREVLMKKLQDLESEIRREEELNNDERARELTQQFHGLSSQLTQIDKV